MSTHFVYLHIPKSAGTHEIGSIVLTSFDPWAGKLITKRTKAVTVTASPGEKTADGPVFAGISRENLKVLDRDIRFIRTTVPDLTPGKKAFYMFDSVGVRRSLPAGFYNLILTVF